MAKKKKSLIKKRITKDLLQFEGVLSLSNLQNFIVDMEEEGIKDLSADMKEFDGQYVKCTFNVIDEEDVTDKGFLESQE